MALVGVREAAADASRLIFFFFFELLGVEAAAAAAPLPPAPRELAGCGVVGVAKVAGDRNLAAAAAGDDHCGEAGSALPLHGVRMAARAG
jgi:hypothetical protein